MNKRLMLALLLPILLILIISLSIFLPRLLIHPDQDFLVAVNPVFCGSGAYQIKDGEISLQARSTNKFCSKIFAPLLYRYSAQENRLVLVGFTQAKNFKLDVSPLSKQGLRLVTDAKERNSQGLNFFMASYSPVPSIYLTGKWFLKEISFPKDEYSFRNDVIFIGWIEP